MYHAFLVDPHAAVLKPAMGSKFKELLPIPEL